MDYARDTSLEVTDLVLVQLIDADGSSTAGAWLHYSPSDPYAVTITFIVGESEVGWTFDRDLLLEGLHEPAGLGDVHLRPCLDCEGRTVVVIELHSPHGAALVEAPASDLHRFAGRMTTLVRPGAESQHMDVDAAIAAILVANAAE